MKIAFFSPTDFSRKLGATKNRIELADALRKLGWEPYLIGIKELEIDDITKFKGDEYRFKLKEYLIKNSKRFDVVLYEYHSLPFSRDLFDKNTLFIARPAILHHHLNFIKFKVDLKTKIKGVLEKFHQFFDHKKKNSLIREENNRNSGLLNADIIQVQNSIDAKFLEKIFPNKKIIIIPNGIGEDRYNAFNSINRDYIFPLSNPKIAFVGTFDFRKGAMDFVYIVKRIKQKYPNIKFKFLGTKGLFQTEREVVSFFPRRLRANIEVIPTFEPDELPNLLTDCHLGVFPSYLESFGFGALEMMCSGLPVIGYDSPGPSDFLIRDLKIEVGNKEELVEKAIELLSNRKLLSKYILESKIIAEKYQWNLIAKNADKIYKENLKLLRNE